MGALHAAALATVGLVGHSYGGAVAVRAAELLPLGALVLYEANAVQLLREEAPPGGEVRAYWRAMLDAQRAGDADGFGEAFCAFWFGAGSWGAMPAEARARLLRQMVGLDLQCTMLLNEAAEGTLAALVAALSQALRARHGEHQPARLAPRRTAERGRGLCLRGDARGVGRGAHGPRHPRVARAAPARRAPG